MDPMHGWPSDPSLLREAIGSVRRASYPIHQIVDEDSVEDEEIVWWGPFGGLGWPREGPLRDGDAKMFRRVDDGDVCVETEPEEASDECAARLGGGTKVGRAVLPSHL